MCNSKVLSLVLMLLVPGCALGGDSSGDGEPQLGDGRADNGAALRDDVVALPWHEAVALGTDSETLPAILRNAGITLPTKSGVYAARIVDDDPAHRAFSYRTLQAGQGAFATDFWPASSIKLIATLAAIERVHALNYLTQNVSVYYPGNVSFRMRDDLMYRTLVNSSNEDYSRLMQVAGLDYVNTQFLTEARGFPTTVLQRSYQPGVDLRSPPTMTLSAGWDRDTTIEATTRNTTDYGGGETDKNITNLFELTEAMRRVVFARTLDESERFAMAESDYANDDLPVWLDTNGSFFLDAAQAVIADDARVYNKVGYTPGESCVDVAVITNFERTERYLLAAYTPFEQGCPLLDRIARATLSGLRNLDMTVPLRSGPQDEIPIQVDPTATSALRITTAIAGAARVDLFDSTGRAGIASTATRGTFAFEYTPNAANSMIIVRALDARGNVIAHRAARIEL